MNPRPFLWLSWLLSLSLFIHFNEATFSIKKVNFDSIDKWTAVGVNAGVLGQDAKNLDAALNLITSVGSAIPYVAPFATLISGIIGMSRESELKQVMNKLEYMNKKLDRLDDMIQLFGMQLNDIMNSLKDVLQKIDSTHIIMGYKSKIENINNLKRAYERYTTNPTNITMDYFRRECATNNMLKFVHWIESELNGQTHLPLQQVMLHGYNMSNFIYWSNQIVAQLTSAIFLHTTCLGMSGYDYTIISETLHGGINGNATGDNQILIQVLKNVTKGINQGAKFIKRSFVTQAKQEVENFMAKHANLGHHEFVHNLKQQLTEKYFWRSWAVAIWKHENITEQNFVGESTDNAWYWSQNAKRSVLVGSVLSHKSHEIYSKLSNQIAHCKISYIASRFPTNEIAYAKYVYHSLRSCPYLKIHFLAVTITGRIDFYWKGAKSNDLAYETSIPGFYQYGDYSQEYIGPKKVIFFKMFMGPLVRTINADILVVPNEPLASIKDSDVCAAIGDNRFKQCYGDYHCCPNLQVNEFVCCPDTDACTL